MPHALRQLSLSLGAAVALSACRAASTTAPRIDRTVRHSIVPAPSSIDLSPTDSFQVTPRTIVYIDASASSELQAIGDYTANLISSAFGATAQRLTGAA